MLLKKAKAGALLDAIAAKERLFVPADDRGTSRFVAYGAGVEPRFDLLNTKLPPKDLLFPATETLYRWSRDGADLAIDSAFAETDHFTVFGLRPCDMASVDRLDAVFLTKGYVDEFYQAKREAATFVVATCAHPGRACFCDSIAASPHEAPTADVLLEDAGEEWVVTPQTEKGASAVEAWKPYLEEGDADPIKAACDLKVDMAAVPEKLKGMFDDPIWSDIGDQCLTCGTCTFVCPTCYCFNIDQDVREDEGKRFRCWDSCMFTDYTAMAGGHNPRASKESRVRQRFMHKLTYFNDRYDMNLCVGCGRCMRDCPAAVDISLIIDRIAASEPAQEKEAMAHA